MLIKIFKLQRSLVRMLARGRDHHGHDQKGVMRNSVGKKIGQDEEDIALREINNEKTKNLT